MQFNSQRSSQACKLFWKNAAHPALNKEKWTQDEDKALVELVAVYNGTNWQEIAAHLGVWLEICHIKQITQLIRNVNCI